MAIIGSIVIGMVAQTDKFLAPLFKAQKALAGFGADLGKYLSGPVGRLETMLGSMGRAIGGAFEGIDKAGDAADRIGTTTAALTSLRYAAKLTGSETEALDAALLKFSSNLGDAVASDITPAAKALQRMKIDPKKLASEDITVAFAQVADGMKLLGTDAEKNAALMDLFGKGGVQIANTMRAGGAEISRLAAEYRGFGGAVSEVQRQQVATMQDSIDRAEAALAGLGTTVAVAVSPYIDAAITEFTGMAAAGEGAGDKVTGAMDWIVRRMANVADFIQGARNVFLSLEIVASKTFVAIMNGAATLARGLDSLLKQTTGYTTGIGEFLSTFAVEFETTSKEFQDGIWKTLGDDAWGDKFTKTADAAIAKSREMAQAAADGNKKVSKTVENMTTSQEASDRAARKATADWASRAHSIWEEVQTPLDKYQVKLADIHSALKGGAITPDIAGRAIAKARGDFEGPTRFAGALDMGSTEARSAILQAISGRGPKDDMVAKNTSDMAGTLKRIEDLQRKAAALDTTETELAMY